MAYPVGRPPKVKSEERQEIFEAFSDYIDRTPDPTIVGFVAYDPVAIKYRVTDDNIDDWKEFSALRKRAIKKQEAYMVYGASTGKLNPTFCIFRLKQKTFGWTDQRQVDNKVEYVQPIVGGLAKAVVDEDDDNASQ